MITIGLIILILIYNILTNIMATKTCASSIEDVVLHEPWFIKVPTLVWYWFVFIYHYRLIPFIIRIIGVLTTGAVATILWSLFICKYPSYFEVSFYFWIIVLAICIYFIVYYLSGLVEYYTKRKKKRKTNDNNRES